MIYLLTIFFPIATAASIFVLRRRSGLAIFAALAALLAQMLLVALIPLDDPTRFLGVTLTLNALNRVFMLAFVAIGACALVAAWHLPHGENFVPIALLTIGLVCGVLLLQDPFITALLLVATGLMAVLAIVDLPYGASELVGTRAIAAALKYLVLMVVAGVLMYIGFVLTDIYRPGELPDRISPARFILALLVTGFALRLALIPFHTWLVDLFEHAAPLVSALVITLLNTTSLLVLVLVFQSFPTLLSGSGPALDVMRVGALISTLIGGGLALSPASLRRSLAYLVVVDSGMVFYGLAALSTAGLAGAIFGALNQTLAVSLIAISLALLERPDGRAPGAARNDLLRRWPVAGAGLICGGLALLGLPPFSGGVGRQLIYQAAAGQGQLELLALLAATALAGAGLARAIHGRLLGPGDPEAPAPEPLMLGETELDRPAPRRLVPEPRSAAALVALLMLLVLGIGLFPQPLLATINDAIRGLSFIRIL